MTRPRRELVSLDDTPFYHCISRCVRRAFLCGKDPRSGKDLSHRKEWLLERLQLLSEAYAIDVAAYAILSNHYHLVLRIDAERARGWSLEEVLERWDKIHSLDERARRHRAGEQLDPVEASALQAQVEVWRERLYDLGWFMRDLNEPVARRANEEDGCTGRFWEGRFRSHALLDDGALLSCMAYVDLNPVRAGESEFLEESAFASIRERIRAWRIRAWRGREERRQAKAREAKGPELMALEAVVPGVDLRTYVELVEWTAREEKVAAASIPASAAPLLERLGLAGEEWHRRVDRHEGEDRWFWGMWERLRQVAQRLGQKWVWGMGEMRRMEAT